MSQYWKEVAGKDLCGWCAHRTHPMRLLSRIREIASDTQDVGLNSFVTSDSLLFYTLCTLLLVMPSLLGSIGDTLSLLDPCGDRLGQFLAAPAAHDVG